MTEESVTAYCECTPVVETQFGEEGQSPSDAVVEAVATVAGSSATDLPPLYDTLDSDALNRLVTERGGPSQPTIFVEFSYVGWKVFVRDDGAIRVCDPDRPSERAPAFEKPLGQG